MEYSLQDFLLFSPEVYWRLLDNYIATHFWIAAILNVIFITSLSSIKNVNPSKIILLLLAICWVWLGWRFYIIEYGSINWFARYIGVLCLSLAPAFLAIALHIRDENHKVEVTLVALTIVYIALIRPLLIQIMGHGLHWSGLGIQPVPTLLASIGIVLAIQFSYKWLLITLLILLLGIEVVTLFLLQDDMWQEGPVILAMMLMVAYSGKYKNVRLAQ